MKTHSSLYLRESANESLLDNELYGNFRGNFLELSSPKPFNLFFSILSSRWTSDHPQEG